METTSASNWFKAAFGIGIIATIVGSIMLFKGLMYNLFGDSVTGYYLIYILFEDNLYWLTYVAQQAWPLFGLVGSLICIIAGINKASKISDIVRSKVQKGSLLALFASLLVVTAELIIQTYSIAYLPSSDHANFRIPNNWELYVIGIISATAAVGLVALLIWVYSSFKTHTLRLSDATLLILGYIFIGLNLYIPYFADQQIYTGLFILAAMLFTLGWWRLMSFQQKAPLVTTSHFDKTFIMSIKITLGIVIVAIIFITGYTIGGYIVYAHIISSTSLYQQAEYQQPEVARQTTPSAISAN